VAVNIDLVLIGLAIALDPLPLVAYFVVLSSKRGVRKGAAFILGWLVSLAIVVTITLVATGNNPPRPQTVPSVAALVVKAAIGAGLVALAVRQRRKMGLPKKPKPPPKWQAGVDNMSLLFAFGLAPLLQPWGLIAAGAARVVDTEVGNVGSGVALFLFCVLATSSYVGLELYAAFRPERAQVALGTMKTWMEDHTDQIIVVGCLVVGFWLIASSIYLLVS
jgi:hypothetical protein